MSGELLFLYNSSVLLFFHSPITCCRDSFRVARMPRNLKNTIIYSIQITSIDKSTLFRYIHSRIRVWFLYLLNPLLYSKYDSDFWESYLQSITNYIRYTDHLIIFRDYLDFHCWEGKWFSVNNLLPIICAIHSVYFHF